MWWPKSSLKPSLTVLEGRSLGKAGSKFWHGGWGYQKRPKKFWCLLWRAPLYIRGTGHYCVSSHLGGFHLVAKIIRELKNHMIPYKFKCSHWLNWQHSDWRAIFHQWEHLNLYGIMWFLSSLMILAITWKPPYSRVPLKPWWSMKSQKCKEILDKNAVFFSAASCTKTAILAGISFHFRPLVFR